MDHKYLVVGMMAGVILGGLTGRLAIALPLLLLAGSLMDERIRRQARTDSPEP